MFDPSILIRDAGPVLATVAIIVFGKSLAAFAIVRMFGHPTSTALTISASLAQIGEFSFILAGLGVSLALLPERARDLILAGAILSILLNPLIFSLLDWMQSRAEGDSKDTGAPEPDQANRAEIPLTTLSDHVVLVGHGRVGRFVSQAIRDTGTPLLVIEDNGNIAEELRKQGIEAIGGNAADPEVVRAANMAGARCLLVAVPDGFEGGQVVEQARRINPGLPIIARSHSDDETAHLRKYGASEVVMGEHEIAKAMVADAVTRFGRGGSVPSSWSSEGEGTKSGGS